jgi:hypothetical protein
VKPLSNTVTATPLPFDTPVLTGHYASDALRAWRFANEVIREYNGGDALPEAALERVVLEDNIASLSTGELLVTSWGMRGGKAVFNGKLHLGLTYRPARFGA